VISSRRKVREEVKTEGTDCSDRFPAFSACFSSYKYPEGFKPIGITKYDGKQAPQQWLRCYSTTIEVTGGSNITKVVYFPMALDPAPLTDLNKHCPKNHFGLPHIDQVVDSMAGCVLLCFLDCYSGYHQIALKEEDQIKTAFITPYGTYAYKTMSFRLKNAGVTYQRVIQMCFTD
jgi:hypothetical protein